MRLFIVCLVCLIILNSCNKKKNNYKNFQTNIEVDFTDVEIPKDSMVYIQKYNPDGGRTTKLDSFKLKSRKLIIKKNYKEAFLGVLASNPKNKKAFFDYVSPQLIFTGDKITIKLYPFLGNSVVKGGENELYDKNQFIIYAPQKISTNDISNHIDKLGYIPKNHSLYKNWNDYEKKVYRLVSDYPDSFLVLYNLYQNRYFLSESTIRKCLSLFKNNFNNTEIYNKLSNYIEVRKRIKINDIFPKLIYLDEKLNKVNTIFHKKNKELYILDFWASWCGPCRKQAKYINENYSKIDTSKIQLISISVDKEEAKWLKANIEEKLKWESYLITKNVPRIFLCVPTYIVLDKNKRIIEISNSIDSIKAFNF